jgi:hypothetical protein
MDVAVDGNLLLLILLDPLPDMLKGGGLMHRPSAEEFLLTLLETLDDLPPDLARRFAELLTKEHLDRSAAIRQLFEDVAGE